MRAGELGSTELPAPPASALVPIRSPKSGSGVAFAEVTRLDECPRAPGRPRGDVDRGPLEHRADVKLCPGMPEASTTDVNDGPDPLGDAPLAGSDHEAALCRLRGAHDETRHEWRPRMVSLTAETGVGKTRVVQELIANLPRATPTGLQGSRPKSAESGGPDQACMARGAEAPVAGSAVLAAAGRPPRPGAGFGLATPTSRPCTWAAGARASRERGERGPREQRHRDRAVPRR